MKEPGLDCPLIVDPVLAPFTQPASTGSKGQALGLRKCWNALECFGEQGVLGYSRWVCQTLFDNLLAVGIAGQEGDQGPDLNVCS